MTPRRKHLRSHESHMGSSLYDGRFSSKMHTMQRTCKSCAVDLGANATWGVICRSMQQSHYECAFWVMQKTG